MQREEVELMVQSQTRQTLLNHTGCSPRAWICWKGSGGDHHCHPGLRAVPHSPVQIPLSPPGVRLTRVWGEARSLLEDQPLLWAVPNASFAAPSVEGR